MRLPNGYGSVYKLSGNRRRPWIVIVTTGWCGETGKRLRYIVGYYATKVEALDALADYNKNPLGEKLDVTLGEVYKSWYNRRYVNISEKEKKKKFKSAEMYRIAWNHLSVLKDTFVKNIKTSHIQKIIDKMVKDNLGYSSCQKVRVLASQLLKVAMADDIIRTNYARLVELPTPDKVKRDVFSELEVRTLQKKVDEIPWVDTILIFIYTGMRISELLALTKFNIDIEHMLITGGAKTDAGKDRIIPIHPKIQPFVTKWYEIDGEHFITRNGKPIRTAYYRSYLYYPALEQAGVRRLTPHKARHTFGTMLDRAGAKKTAIQKLMGHADYSTTANIYTHPDVKELREAINLL